MRNEGKMGGMKNKKSIIDYLEQIVSDLKNGSRELVQYRFTNDVESSDADKRFEFETKKTTGKPPILE
jgi:hypothetical protein